VIDWGEMGVPVGNDGSRQACAMQNVTEQQCNFHKETFWCGRDVALYRKSLMVILAGRVNGRVVL